MATQDMDTKLDVLIRLNALQLVGDKTGADAIMILGRAGLDNELVAQIVGTTPATVRATLSRLRRHGSRARPQPVTTTSGEEN
jgi:DNA-binding CsgD family transcriptional regulator